MVGNGMYKIKIYNENKLDVQIKEGGETEVRTLHYVVGTNEKIICHISSKQTLYHHLYIIVLQEKTRMSYN